MYHPTRLLASGFAIVILMMIILAAFAFQSSGIGDRQISTRVSKQLEKIDLINELSTIIQARTRFMQSMLLQGEAALAGKSPDHFDRLSGAYRETRERLLPLLAPRERDIMAAIDRLDSDINDLNRQGDPSMGVGP